MTVLLVLAALEAEARWLAAELGLTRVAACPWPRFAGGGVEILTIGPGAARLESRWLRTGERPGLVVSAGVCGALSPVLAVAGTLAVPRTVMTLSGVQLTVAPDIHARALAAAASAGYTPAVEPLVTTDEIVDTPAARAALWRRTGAVAVDMESAVVLGAAEQRGVPALVVRAVSDTAGQSVPRELMGLVDEAGRTRLGRAAFLALRRPGLISTALSMGWAAARAIRSVAAVLGQLVEQERKESAGNGRSSRRG